MNSELPFAQCALAGELSRTPDCLGLLSRPAFGRLLVLLAELHFPEHPFALELFFQHPESLIDIVVPNHDLHAMPLPFRRLDQRFDAERAYSRRRRRCPRRHPLATKEPFPGRRRMSGFGIAASKPSQRAGTAATGPINLNFTRLNCSFPFAARRFVDSYLPAAGNIFAGSPPSNSNALRAPALGEGWRAIRNRDVRRRPLHEHPDVDRFQRGDPVEARRSQLLAGPGTRGHSLVADERDPLESEAAADLFDRMAQRRRIGLPRHAIISLAPTLASGRRQTYDDAMHPLIEAHREEILALAERHGMQDVRVFGSMARGDADDSSDVDLLVSLHPGQSGLDLAALLTDVQELLNRRVDVVTELALHPEMRDRVLREAQPL